MGDAFFFFRCGFHVLWDGMVYLIRKEVREGGRGRLRGETDCMHAWSCVSGRSSHFASVFPCPFLFSFPLRFARVWTDGHAWLLLSLKKKRVSKGKAVLGSVGRKVTGVAVVAFLLIYQHYLFTLFVSCFWAFSFDCICTLWGTVGFARGISSLFYCWQDEDKAVSGRKGVF